MGRSSSWTIPLDIGAFAAIESQVHAFLDEAGARGRAAFAAQLVVEEIVRNLIEHTPPYAVAETITIELDVAAERVIVQIEDLRPPFDPSSAPQLNVDARLDARSPRGMGLHLVQTMTDELRYERIGDRNRLTATVFVVEPGPTRERRHVNDDT